ncbi:hypothetical protein [Methylocella sp.]|uniref:hypothetical protein n=1 Tax=Methylocella sp. TaxID=1978226 RepID=UPI0037837B34
MKQQSIELRRRVSAVNAQPTGGIFAALALMGAATATGAALLASRASPPPSRDLPTPPSRGPSLLPASPVADKRGADRAARRLNRAAGTIAASVLIDSAMEHYRGRFENKAMYTPLIVSALTILASFHGHRDRARRAHPARDSIYGLAGLTGAVGSAFHVYNVGKRVGGFRWQNIFYGAPLGAPMAIALSGITGFLAERVRDNPAGTVPSVFGAPAGRMVAALTGAGLIGTTAEAGLLHFRGAFHNPAMLLPVTAPPVAAALLGAAAVGEADRPRPLTRWWLRFTAFLGVAGVGFHAIGVARNMGGWSNWRQNIQAGPPLPAPPAFFGLALAGLAALGLLQDNPDD